MTGMKTSLFTSISRRDLLKLLGISTIGGWVAYSRFSKPKPSHFQEDFLDLPYDLTHPKKVVVIGGGLAGLACAYELSQRGFSVTLLERSPQCGGKIASWPIQVGEKTMMMEHGFHGFFPQYYNLKSIVNELNIDDHFISLKFYSVLFKNNQYQPEIFRPNHSAFPWNILDLGMASQNRLKWGINLTKTAHWKVFREITGFHPQKSFERLDQISVSDWVKGEFPRGLYDLYFYPFAKSTLNAPDVLSAGELMQFFHFYFFGNPEGLAFYGTREDMGSSLVEPITNFIRNKGGKILTDIRVSQIDVDPQQINSLSYQKGGLESPVPFWITLNPLLTKTDFNVQYFGAGDRVFIRNHDQQKVLSLTCTHQGCVVKKQKDNQFYCPCHGAIFDQEGRVVSGPAKRNLTSYKIQDSRSDSLQIVPINKTVEKPEKLTADYYVFATDVPGIKDLLTQMKGEINITLEQQINQLQTADPFAVARFWFDRDFVWEQSNFTSLSGYDLTDSITLYHRIQDEFIQWHKETGGSVVELHAYCYKEQQFPDQETLLKTFKSELYEIVPELQGATLLHQELVNQKNFSGYPPGSYAERPKTTTEINNLFLAGDWVKMPFPCGLMERAVSSGLLAANMILQKEGLQRRTLLTVNPEGVLQI